METWDERERMDGLVQAAGRAARLAGRLAGAGVEPNPRTRRAFLTAAEQADHAVKSIVDRSITVDATALQALEHALKRVRKEARAVEGGRTPETQPFVSLLENARAARRQTAHFFHSAPRPSDASLAEMHSRLGDLLDKMDEEHGPVPPEIQKRVIQALDAAWERLQH